MIKNITMYLQLLSNSKPWIIDDEQDKYTMDPGWLNS